MLMWPLTVRVFLSTEPADMRRSFEGLAAIVREAMGADPLSGHLFVFRNRRADGVKILYWDRSGLALWYKRIEKGLFRFPTSDGASQEVEASDLALLLEGIDLAVARRRERFEPVRHLS
ncbi:MAG: IS66 family insertion sequence element accessory protein TnpB [Planctomycetota bacterium]|nr:IS66 family insertion sequence element accessory protein TnpB [Planctomycetota bacterium]